MIPREWEGAAFILGGGPSLSGFDASCLNQVIGVNEAGLTLAPWSVLFWADARWIQWNHDRIHLHRGKYRFYRHNPTAAPSGYSYSPKIPEILKTAIHVQHEKKSALSRDPSKVAGICSGSSAINLAWLMGASRIVLLGFDMKPGNFHDKHKKTSSKPDHYGRFMSGLNRMSKSLESVGCEVFNCTPDSALECFPKRPLEDFL